MGLTGLAARGATQDLESLVAEHLQRELVREQMAERARQAKVETKQRDRQLDLTEKSYKSSIADRDADNARADAAARAAADAAAYKATARSNMSELVGNPQQLAAFSIASGEDIPAGAREIVKPKTTKLVPIDVPGPNGTKVRKMVAEDDPSLKEGVRVYTEPKSGGGDNNRQWLMRDGKEVYDVYRPGDARAGAAGKSNSSTPEQQAKAQQTIRTVLGRVKDLSAGINTGTGFMAKLDGALRTGKAYLGMDDDVAEYTALLDGAIPFLARAYGHTGVLTQQDVDSVRNSMPKPQDPATLAIRKLKNAEAIMLGLVGQAEEKLKAGGGAPGGDDADDLGDDVTDVWTPEGGLKPRTPRKK